MEDQDARIKKLEREVELLKQKRVYQTDIVPQAIKTRHHGEACPFVYSGLEADRPDGFQNGNSVTYFFATDTNKLWIWNGTAYKSTTLT